jgi:hypothetical protein
MSSVTAPAKVPRYFDVGLLGMRNYEKRSD